MSSAATGIDKKEMTNEFEMMTLKKNVIFPLFGMKKEKRRLADIKRF